LKSILAVLLISSACASATFSQNCFTILVGKNASTDGSVFVAHNEDDLNDHNFVDLHKVPRIRHSAGEKQIFLSDADSLDEVPETFGYFWITGSKYNEDLYLNEWGVTITSNSSQSKVQNGNGRIGHNLRKIVIERARTAKEAVRIAGSLVDTYGYASSGRVYAIADPDEAWVFEVANGKHWIARRVPDDEVAIIPNYYVIDDFQKEDTTNFLASPDIISFAAENGWYDSLKDASFNFRKVYGHSNRLDAIWNIARKWVILNTLSARQFAFNADFPFSIKPEHKVDIPTLITLLGNHSDNTQFNHLASPGSTPHHQSALGINDTMSVCNLYNDNSCIVQLRSWLPPEIGDIAWISPRYPCLQPFIPWYSGIGKVSSDYEKEPYTQAIENFNRRNRDYITLFPDHACWSFDDFANMTDSNYVEEIESIKRWKTGFQTDVFKSVKETEARALKMYETDHDGALQIVTALSSGLAERALKETREGTLRIRTRGQ
jgi:dipeptidase